MTNASFPQWPCHGAYKWGHGHRISEFARCDVRRLEVTFQKKYIYFVCLFFISKHYTTMQEQQKIRSNCSPFLKSEQVNFHLWTIKFQWFQAHVCNVYSYSLEIQPHELQLKGESVTFINNIHQLSNVNVWCDVSKPLILLLSGSLTALSCLLIFIDHISTTVLQQKICFITLVVTDTSPVRKLIPVGLGRRTRATAAAGKTSVWTLCPLCACLRGHES